MPRTIQLQISDESRELELSDALVQATVTALDDGAFLVQTATSTKEVYVSPGGTLSDGNALGELDLRIVTAREQLIRDRFREAGANGGKSGSGNLTIKAPMPGLVRAVNVVVGDRVEKGATVVVLEAMKMENNIAASATGIVRSIFASAGVSVDKNARLLEIERAD